MFKLKTIFQFVFPDVIRRTGILCLALATVSASAAMLTLQTNVLGTTPEILAYNSGHFYTNSNTRDWWRYAGVNGARVFVSPSDIEASDDLAPVGDGVTDQASFVARKAALRTDPLNPAYKLNAALEFSWECPS